MEKRKTIWGRGWSMVIILVVIAGFMIAGYMIGKDRALKDNRADREAAAAERS